MAGVQFREPIDLNKLEIRNAALQNLAADPSTGVDGQIWQRTDIDKTKICTGAKVETVRYESNHLFDASTASGNGPLVINTDGTGTDTALSIGATGINSPRLLVDVATQTPKLQAYTVAASTSMEPTLIQAVDSNSRVDMSANSLKVYRTDIVESMELTTSDLLKNGVSVLAGILALGETSVTAYRGDRGKTAFDHSQTTGNPHGTGIGDIANLQNELDSKQNKKVYNWNRNDITGAGWAKILSCTLSTSSGTTCSWLFNIIKLGSLGGYNSRIGKLHIQWRNGVLNANFFMFDGADSAYFGYTGSLAKGSLFEVFAYCVSYPHLILEVDESWGGVIEGGVFTSTNPSMTEINTTAPESRHDRSEITAATDFRSLDIGCYRVSGGTWHANNPGTGVYNWGVVWVEWRGSSERIVIYKADVIPGNSSGGLWVDSAFGGTWRGWHQIASKQYLDTVYANKNASVVRWASGVGGDINLNYDMFVWTYSGAVGLSMALGNGSFDGQRMEIFNCNANSSAGTIVVSGTITGPTSVPRYTSLRLVWVASTSRWYSAA